MRRVRIEIGELRVHGTSPVEASRLRDALIRELGRAAAELPAVQPRQVEHVDAGRARVPDGVDRQAAVVAAAVLAGVRQ